MVGYQARGLCFDHVALLMIYNITLQLLSGFYLSPLIAVIQIPVARR